MHRLALACAAAMMSCGIAQAQPCGADFADARKLEAPGYTLLFRTKPAKIAVGHHFAVEMLACGTEAPAGIAVDAYMPEHRHGMNYKPVVKVLGGGRFEADGLMLHMPGRWEFRFDIARQGRTDHLASPFVLK
jgi:hypothetical protein